MNRKLMIAGISGVLTLVLFLALIIMQKQATGDGTNVLVYYSKAGIERNTHIPGSDIDWYFTAKATAADLVAEGAVTERTDLEEIYTAADIAGNEQITRGKITRHMPQAEIIHPVEYAIQFKDTGDAVGGILREGDFVDLILTRTSGTRVVTTTILENVQIARAYAPDGTQLDQSAKDGESAMSFNLRISALAAHQLDNALAMGKIRMVRKLDDNLYGGISIETSK
jgi:Flp pilus assembly protein CpaB